MSDQVKPEIVLCEHGACVAHHGPLVIAITDGPEAFRPDVARRAIESVARLRRTTHKSRLVYVYLAGERSGLPNAEAREITSSLTDYVDTGIGIHEGGGFRASAVRAVVTGIAMMSRGRAKLDICATVSEAVAMLRQRHPDLGSTTELHDAIEAARAAARATA